MAQTTSLPFKTNSYCFRVNLVTSVTTELCGEGAEVLRHDFRDYSLDGGEFEGLAEVAGAVVVQENLRFLAQRVPVEEYNARGKVRELRHGLRRILISKT